MLAPAQTTLESVSAELANARDRIKAKTRRRTRLVSGLLRQFDEALARLADLQVEFQALETACQAIAELEAADQDGRPQTQEGA